MKGKRARVAVAGAAGAIGRSVCEALAKDYDVIALVGSAAMMKEADAGLPFTWRYCEPFSRREVEAAVAGCDYAVYLVHTRLPTARLVQAECEDMDLLIADNFARAARRNGVKQIVYLGGHVPEGNVSRKILDARNEVVEALAFYGTPVTSLRAGLVVSPGSKAVLLLSRISVTIWLRGIIRFKGLSVKAPCCLAGRWTRILKNPGGIFLSIRGKQRWKPMKPGCEAWAMCDPSSESSYRRAVTPPG